MARTFRTARFPTGVAHIRTPVGAVVDFVDGVAVVDDPALAAGLLAVPADFEITEDTPAKTEPAATPASARRPRTKK